MNQPNANTSQPENLARSEMAPLIRATVMMANIIWKARITYVGMPTPLGAASVTPQISETNVLFPRYWVKLPRNLLTEVSEFVPKATLNP